MSNVSWATPAFICSSKHKIKLYFEFLMGKVSANTYKTYPNKFNRLLKTRKTQCFNNIIDKHRKNAKAMWNMLNNYLSRSKPAKSLNIPNVNPDALNTFFSEFGPNDSKNIKPVNHFSKYLSSKTYSSIFIQPITPEELISTVKKFTS